MSGFLISNRSIPFSNKHEENQYKLSNEVQYILGLTKHNNRGTQMCPPAQNTWEKRRLGRAKLRVWWRWCPRVHVWEGEALVAGLVLPFSLLWFLPGLCSRDSWGEGEGWELAEMRFLAFVAPGLTWVGRIPDSGLGGSAAGREVLT